MDAGRRTADLLERRPELEGALEAVLAVDEREEGWTFEDVPVDSGAFGELVAADVVTEAGDGYRVVDPESVRRVLTDGEVETDSESRPTEFATGIGSRLLAIDRMTVALFLVTFSFFVAVRSFVFGSVFRTEHVVLAGNDPYYYRYWTEQVLANSGLGWGLVADLPGSVTGGEPLLVATLGLVSGLLGGREAAGAVLAVYPVIAAVLVAMMLYRLTVRVTADRRVGLAAVAMLAVIPGTALRTSLGYADHHAFDYVWLVLTALALVAVLDHDRTDTLYQPRNWICPLALAIGVAAQTLAWEGGPLLLIPIGFVIVGRGLQAVRDDRSPLLDMGKLLAGLWFGALSVLAVHVLVGWHGPLVAGSLLLLAGAGTGVVVLSELAGRLGRAASELLVAEVGIAATLVVGIRFGLPTVWNGVGEVLGTVTRLGTTSEAQALFDAGSLGFLLVYGPIQLVVTVAFLSWATGRLLQGANRWLVPGVYAWYFLTLTLFQVRFIGELAPFAAMFAGLGFAWLAAWVDLASPPAPFAERDRSFRTWVPARPEARTVGYVLALFALIGGIGLVQSAIKVEQIAVDDQAYQTAAWMEDHADERGWDDPSESYVFSRWDVNRMYNYFVNGESGGYAYARNNYENFLARTDSRAAYSSIDGRVAFVLTRTRGADPPTMQSLLHERNGSRNDRYPGTGHFRTLFVSGDGTYTVSEPVSGAVLTGTAAPNATVTASTDVSVPGASFTYERQTTANETGAYTLRVSYAGSYTVTTGDETWEVTADDSAITAGERVSVEQ